MAKLFWGFEFKACWMPLPLGNEQPMFISGFGERVWLACNALVVYGGVCGQSKVEINWGYWKGRLIAVRCPQVGHNTSFCHKRCRFMYHQWQITSSTCSQIRTQNSPCQYSGSKFDITTPWRIGKRVKLKIYTNEVNPVKHIYLS